MCLLIGGRDASLNYVMFLSPTGAKIQERIPGKRYILPDDPIYDPFGRPGGGAPMMDRYGNRNTHTFGNFEKKVGPYVLVN